MADKTTKKETEKVKAKTVSTKKRVVKKEKVSLDDRKKRVIQRLEQRSRYKRRRHVKREEEELDVKLVSIRRVSKVKAGGKRLKLSVMVVVGDKTGKIGVAIAKGKDVKSAQGKAVNQAKKKMFKVPMKGQTIPHEVTEKYKAAKVFLKPAAPGTGVIAGGAVRAVVEVAGIKDILSKLLGTKNTISNVYATVNALKKLRLTRFDDE